MEKSFKITPEQIVEILIHRRWYIIIPFIFTMSIGIYFALTLDKIYQTKTMILVQPQKVPEDFVQSVVSSDLDERVSTIYEQIMSRTNLEKIINEFDLFSSEQKETMYKEDMIGSLRRRIRVDSRQGSRGETESFSISFRGRNPVQITKVTNALASYFIDQNLKVREEQAIGTSKFLDDELTAMRANLIEMEGQLKKYREENMGSLPEQPESILHIVDRLQDTLTNKQNTLRDSKLLLISLNKQLEEAKRYQNYFSGGAAQEEGADGSFTFNAADSLLALKRELSDLEIKYTPKHPDIIRLKKKIEDLEAQNAKQDSDPNEPSQNVSFEGNNNPFVQSQLSLYQEVEATNREIIVLKEEIRDLEKKLMVYQKRIEEIPKKEQELLSLKRDYNEVSETYQSLLQRKLEAELAVNMEKKQKGEQFRILDPAKVPSKPIEPDMMKIFMMAIASGLGIGGGLIFLREYFNDSYKTIDEIESGLELPVLAVIPIRLTRRVKWYKRINFAMSIIGVGVSISLFSVFAAITMIGEKDTMEIIKQLNSYL